MSEDLSKLSVDELLNPLASLAVSHPHFAFAIDNARELASRLAALENLHAEQISFHKEWIANLQEQLAAAQERIVAQQERIKELHIALIDMTNAWSKWMGGRPTYSDNLNEKFKSAINVVTKVNDFENLRSHDAEVAAKALDVAVKRFQMHPKSDWKASEIMRELLTMAAELRAKK